MTSTTLTSPTTTVHPTHRTLSVARLLFVPWLTARGLPWGIMASSFVVNLVLFGVLGDTGGPDHKTGGLASLYIMFFFVYARAMIETFPFAVSLGVTRRRFATAIGGLVVVESLGYGVVLYLLRLLERATGGWGVSMHFFGIDFVTQDNPVAQMLAYAGPLLAIGFLGATLGIVFKRWGANGMYVLSIGSILVLGGLAVLVTWRDGWSAVGHWFADQPALALLAGWPALLAALLAAAGFATIRRAAP